MEIFINGNLLVWGCKMRELFKINLNKLKEEDRRFLLNKNSSEILHYDQMLMTNKILIITIFALFTALVSLIIYFNYITIINKIIFVVIMTCFIIYLLITFYNSKTNINKDKNRIVQLSADLFKLHLAYAKK